MHAGVRAAALALFALTLLCNAPRNAHAFGANAHRTIAELAQRQLSPQARAQVDLLLEGEPDPTLAGVASWADEIRGQPAYRWSGPLHYVNFPRDAGCRYDARRDCREGRCVVGALERYGAVLADPGRPRSKRVEALKFVVHFAGDVHQPMHAAYGDDRGGNRFQVNHEGRGTNLHALWDHEVLKRPGHDWRRYADVLEAREPSQGTTAWAVHAPRQWAEESCRLLENAGIYPSRPGRLPKGYIERQRPILEARVRLAGDRLAALLNATLGDPSAPGAGTP